MRCFELFLNEQSLGKKATRKDAAAINWQVQFQAGTLKAVATTGGKQVASDIERLQASERKAYQGRALAILRATGEGEITLTAKAEGLAAATLEAAAAR